MPAFYVVNRLLPKEQAGPILQALSITPVSSAIISNVLDADLALTFSPQILRCPTENDSHQVAQLYWSDKFISTPRYSLNEAVAVLIIAQGFPQEKDILAQIALFHKAFRPKGFHQFVFFQGSPTVLNQEKKCIEHFGSERHLLAIAHQDALRRIEPKFGELVKHLCLVLHYFAARTLKTVRGTIGHLERTNREVAI